MENIFANFLWGSYEGKNKCHWVAWKKLCYPTERGGIGIKSIQDISDSLGAKLWWHYRTERFLWADILNAKYASTIHPVARKWSYTQYH